MDDVEIVKSKLNIVDIINPYTPLKKAGKNYMGRCPFHKEKTPSFSVSEEMQRYKCFGCGKAGDVFNFIMEVEKLDFTESLEFLAAKAGITLQKKVDNSKTKKTEKDQYFKINNFATFFFNEVLLKHPLAENARKYLADRKITENTIKEFKLGFAPESWDALSKLAVSKGLSTEILVKVGLSKPRQTNTGNSQQGNQQRSGIYDVFRNRLMVPMIDPFNKIVGFSGRVLSKNDNPKYLNTSETPIFHKQEFLFGLSSSKNFIRQENYAILVEGLFDMITPYQFGIKNIVATGGTALTEKQLLLLKKYTDNVVLLYDSDAAGLDAMLRGIDLIVTAGLNLKISTLPKPFKDPDEAAIKNLEVLKTAISEAIPIWDFYFLYISKKFNLDDIFQKKTAFKFIKENLAKIPDPLIKSDYIDKAARFFSVDKNLFNNLASGAPIRSSNQTQNQAPKVVNSVVDAGHNGRIFGLYLLALTLNIRYAIIEYHLKDIEPEFFEDEELGKVYNEFIQYANNARDSGMDETKEFRRNFYEYFSNKHPELVHNLEEIYLTNFSENLLEEANLKTEILKGFRRLKRNFLLKLRKKLIDDIKKAEIISDLEQIDILSNKLKLLSDQVNLLTD